MELGMDVSHDIRLDHSQRLAVDSARARIHYSDAEIVEHFRRLGYDVAHDELAFTTETVTEFAEARLAFWHRAGHLATQEGGLLIVERAQPHPRQRTRDIVVVSLGGARVVMGALNAPDCSIGLPRYAKTM
jgi:hypothetical protein